MIPHMRIAIVIPAYNVAPYIAKAIGSVLAQTRGDWRLCVIDDGSTDATAEIAARFADPRIQLIRQENAGVSAARNRGMAALDADAFLFLDADDWLAPHALADLARALQQAPGAVAASGAHARVGAGHLTRVRRPPAGDVLAAFLVRNRFANGGHVLVRPLHRFRTDLRYGEDWDYWVRLALRGRFATTGNDSPLCFVRERAGSAYRRMATDKAATAPCLDAIFANPEVRARFPAADLADLRRRAEAEQDWVTGREFMRHGQIAQGRPLLRRSVAAAPGPRRTDLLALSCIT